MHTPLKQAQHRPTYAELLAEYKNPYIPYERLLQTKEWQEKREKIIDRDRCQCTRCGVSTQTFALNKPILQVHHTFYSVQKLDLKKNKFTHKLPWEYLDEALVTVCNKCHQEIHKTTKIPVFEEVRPGKYAQKDFTPCRRCKAMGYFSYYKHVQQGICFRCSGQRFEELIH
jgi:5-methylcytosine-specific restriction endonuclease McrA